MAAPAVIVDNAFVGRCERDEGDRREGTPTLGDSDDEVVAEVEVDRNNIDDVSTSANTPDVVICGCPVDDAMWDVLWNEDVLATNGCDGDAP